MMKINTRLLVIAFSFFTFCIQGQSKYTADRYFKEFNYPKAAELYTSIHKSGDDSKLVLSRIADSYYFNVDTKNAESWYKLLLEKHQDVDSEHLFRYAQTLRSNGKYELSDKIMLQLGKVDSFDSRSDRLKAIPNYVVLYSKESGDVLSLHNVSTNTKYSDFGGFGIKDRFYFASTEPTKDADGRLYKWNRQPFLNLYEAQITKSSEKKLDLTSKSLLPSPVKTKYHESNAIVTKSGRVMYFTRDNFDGETARRSKKDRKIRLKLYRAIRENGKWTDIQELPFNNDEYSVGHPALSPDEKTLYFVSDMPGGYGATDIYKVSVYSGNTYGEPENLGDVINTEGREMFPFVGSDGTLYFSSDGHVGLGALDMFESRLNSDNKFTKSSNLKSPFNSKLDDFGFWISDNQTKGFFTSNRKGGKGDDDIYGFTLDRKARPVTKVVNTSQDGGGEGTKNALCLQIINGLVTNVNTNAIMPNTVVKLLDEQGKVIQSVKSDVNGMYSFKVLCSSSYKVLATEQDYRPDFKSVFTTPETNVSNRADLGLIPLIVDNQIKINPIYFDFDKWDIRPDAQYELENIVTVMKSNPSMRIRIESHTDSRGDKNYNRNLSDRRAKSTRNYIISRGISSVRILNAQGFGEDRLLNNCDDANRDNCTEEQHQKNRRSYFYIINSSGKEIYKPKDKTIIEKKEVKNKDYHIVEKGQTLYRISVINGISVERIKKLNNIKNNTIYIGQRIKLK